MYGHVQIYYKNTSKSNICTIPPGSQNYYPSLTWLCKLRGQGIPSFYSKGLRVRIDTQHWFLTDESHIQQWDWRGLPCRQTEGEIHPVLFFLLFSFLENPKIQFYKQKNVHILATKQTLKRSSALKHVNNTPYLKLYYSIS